RPALELLIGDAIDDAPIGASRLWGDPDLPPGTAWPTLADCRRWEPDIPLPEDSPCQFVAQLDLAALARSPAARALPAEGLLSLFAHHDWQTGSSSACLRYFESTEGLERVPHAETHPDNARRPPHVASLVEALTIPEGHAGPFVERMGIEPGDWDTIDRHREVLLASGGGVLGVLGHDRMTSGDDPTPGKDWTRLLTAPLDPHATLIHHLALRDADLRAGELENYELVWVDFDGA
ncbi:MAG TPA: DUF1963 domain-containing protein, partial [Polyangiaceae bacterium LLY-WYZ-15_(1-7)]|nr:DUF1963 domain-containing protein [Polyangiaceae bacterium LLY-WYZ-15_(1-7)]